MSPFRVVYEVDPLGPMDLVSRPLDHKLSSDAKERVKEIQKLHKQVTVRIENPMCHTKPKPISTKRKWHFNR